MLEEKAAKDDEEIELFKSLSRSFREAYADEEWVSRQTEKYLRDEEENAKKRFESYKLTFMTFVR